jgi:hypothetical protein
MKAPVGPPIWYLLPPRNEIRNPAIIAVYRDLFQGVAPEAIANAIARGSATTPTVRPLKRSLENIFEVYPSFKTLNSFGYM